MYQPETYGIALFFMLGSMLCWGSWANTMKLAPGFPFQLFYWDYVAGLCARQHCLGLDARQLWIGYTIVSAKPVTG